MTKTSRIGAVLNTLEALENPDKNNFDATLFESNEIILKHPDTLIKVKPIKMVEQLISFDPYSKAYTQDEKFHIATYRSSMQIIDIRNAMKAGKECPVVGFSLNDSSDFEDIYEVLRSLIEDGSETLEELMGDLMDQYKPTPFVTVMVHALPSKRVFSPFAALKLKRLTKAPKKWTDSHLAKVIANGQYLQLVSEKKFSGDYTLENDGKQPLNDGLDPLTQIRKIIQGNLNIQDVDENRDGTVRITYGFQYDSEVYVCQFHLDSKN
jgi:predicted RNA-binding protein